MIERTLDFAKLGVTGSTRFRPRTPESQDERRRKDRAAGARYRERHGEREKARQRAVAARRRQERPEQVREANDYYTANRDTVLEQKRAYYQKNKERILARKRAREQRNK